LANIYIEFFAKISSFCQNFDYLQKKFYKICSFLAKNGNFIKNVLHAISFQEKFLSRNILALKKFFGVKKVFGIKKFFGIKKVFWHKKYFLA